MNIKEKYQDNYILLAGLREYIENGTMLASVNFWRDTAQNFKEFEAIELREDILKNNPEFLNSEFLVAFVKEDFPVIHDEIPEKIIEIAISIIENQEDKQTLTLTKQFLIEYTTHIAKSSKEDWLSFVGLKDAISDKEEQFRKNLKELLNFSS